MEEKKSLIIAVDFDGTIVEDAYPEIGKKMLYAFETLKKLENDGHRLILWTYRAGSKLKEAVDYCKKNGIEFYAVNESYSGELLTSKVSRKINADIFIDDRNVGGFAGWGEVYMEITKQRLEIEKLTKKSGGFFSIFKK